MLGVRHARWTHHCSQLNWATWGKQNSHMCTPQMSTSFPSSLRHACLFPKSGLIAHQSKVHAQGARAGRNRKFTLIRKPAIWGEGGLESLNPLQNSFSIQDLPQGDCLTKNNTHTKHVLSSSGVRWLISLPWSTELSGKCFPPSGNLSPFEKAKEMGKTFSSVWKSKTNFSGDSYWLGKSRPAHQTAFYQLINLVSFSLN